MLQTERSHAMTSLLEESSVVSASRNSMNRVIRCRENILCTPIEHEGSPASAFC
ncbi:hypothetical protein BRADI_5g10183v3 [Brachypodium distachyon]|uniref:Uncharacterized protein n=1 Tax=Brachypodium distachyon TaxID=15368 RepID=A0A2K2CGD2_BRADI|nr:hypothetical protein BRADI_5g10183v3 [Brachypodium distachyon]